MAKIIVKDTEINIIKVVEEDYLCLTDMIRAKDGDFFVTDWLRNRNTLEFIGIWEKVYNPIFNYGEFATIRNQAGLNSFKIRYLYDEYRKPQRLKAEEQKLLGWTAKRELSKINYRIHTDAIKSHLIPDEVTKEQANIIYAEEADVLNVAMFGMTAKQWREANPDLKGNIRDYATINELICLSNMENINAVLINDSIPQGERLIKLNQIAIQQMQVLEASSSRNLLK